jgi:hypothetical protein
MAKRKAKLDEAGFEPATGDLLGRMIVRDVDATYPPPYDPSSRMPRGPSTTDILALCAFKAFPYGRRHMLEQMGYWGRVR